MATGPGDWQGKKRVSLVVPDAGEGRSVVCGDLRAANVTARLDSARRCSITCPTMPEETHASAQQEHAGRNVPREGASVARCLWQL